MMAVMACRRPFLAARLKYEAWKELVRERARAKFQVGEWQAEIWCCSNNICGKGARCTVHH